MLVNIEFRNYRGFSEHILPLKPETIIVGRNNAGKSTVIEGFRLASVVTEPYKNLSFKDVPAWLEIPIVNRGVQPGLTGLNLSWKNIFHHYQELPASIKVTFSNEYEMIIYLGPETAIHTVVKDYDGRLVRTKGQAQALHLPEGKILATSCADYGFMYNGSRDGYVVNEETMAVVRRIFRMVGLEGASITGVARALNREGIEPPGKPWSKSGRWVTSTIRNCIIGDDVYKPHTYDQIKALVVPEVVAQLDPNQSYGVWWYNRTKANTRQVSLNGANGKEYKRQVKYAPRPLAEWIAVPVPDAGVSLEWVDAARAAIKENQKTSNAGRRTWELSGGIIRCGACGYAMVTHTVANKGRPIYFYYFCQTRYKKDYQACIESKFVPAVELETRVWDEVSGLMKSPETLITDLERMIELERQDKRGDPKREAKVWLDKLAGLDRERRAEATLNWRRRGA